MNDLNGLNFFNMLVVTAEQMREMDRLTIQKYGISSLKLMEQAGEGITKAILESFGRAVKKGVVVVAGKGNNGGDGLVVARLLRKKRISCEVTLLARKDELTPDAAHNLAVYAKLRGKITEVGQASLDLLSERMRGKGLLVDAILGTGTKNTVAGVYAEAITLMNSSGMPIVAVDIPSGLDTDRGVRLGVAIQAEMTVALAYPKLGEVIYPGLSYVGDLVVADIGIDCRAVNEVNLNIEVLEPGDIEEGMGAAAAIGDDRLQRRSQGQVVPESFTHGSSEQRVSWFRRGLEAGAPEACDTFGQS